MGDIGGSRAYGMAMRKGLRASNGAGGLLAVLLLVALSIRVLVPAGYMPVRAADGLILSLCSGQGAIPIVVEMPATGDAGDDHRNVPHDSDGPCVFSALASPALQAAAPSIAWAVPALSGEIASPRPMALLLTLTSFVRPPLRGPPLAV